MLSVSTGAVLAAYILGVVLARMKLKDGSQDTLNDVTQALTLVAFISVIWLMVFRGGGIAAWPTLLPFATVQVLGHAIFILSKYLGGRNRVRRIDGFVTTLATTIFSMVAMVIILPKVRGRFAEVLSSVCCVLPVLFALPYLITKPPASEGDDITRAAEVSRLVYTRGTSQIFEEVEFVHNRETGARCGVYVEKNTESKTIYVSFAGSDSQTDWVRTNFDIEAQQYSLECKTSKGKSVVHKGFLKAWKSIEEPVWEKVANVMLRHAGSGRVVVCGHSLGGAMATLASLDIFCKAEETYRKTLSVITFGSPRVGNASFRDLFQTVIPRSVRVVNVYDPVPKTPIIDFVHAADAYVLGGFGGIDPHGIKTYLKSLKNR
jgi:hypothetical protein